MRTISLTGAFVLLALSAARAQPLVLPGAQTPAAAGTQQSSAPTAHGGAAQGAAPRPAAPPAILAAREEGLIDRVLKHQGGKGEAIFKRLGPGYGLKLSADGYQAHNLTEPCAVSFGDQPLPLTALGRPAGSFRYRLEAPICPMVFDVLNGSIFVVEPEQPCVIEAAACRVDVRGLWGPEGSSLLSQSGEIDRARITAEKAVRESYRLLIERANRVDQKIIAREQAGFTSAREIACRDYLREPVHGFCHARFTEARATELRQRLGLKDEAPKPKPKPRPKPLAPIPLGGPVGAPGGTIQ